MKIFGIDVSKYQGTIDWAKAKADGIALILPGDDTATGKHYPYNAAAAFAVGQRVHITRESGTILVEYPIGGHDGA